MKPLGQGSAPGVYHGVIKKARYQNGVMYAQVKILDWSTEGNEYVTNWARVAIPWGTYNWGTWGSIHPGEHVLVAFQNGDPERPLVIGFIPMPQADGSTEMPPEFVNDSYADKSPHTGIRELPPENGPEINPAWIAKSPKWQQYFLLHDKLKKIVLRVCSEGGGDWPAQPTSEKPEILLGELATHNVLLGDLFMELYNNHRHKDVVAGDDISGPPRDEDLIDPQIHLSHVVYVIRDPWDQCPTSVQKAIQDFGLALKSAMGGGGGGGGGGGTGGGGIGQAVEQAQQIAEELGKFCEDPAGYIGDMAKKAGVPGPIVDAGMSIVKNFVGPFLDFANQIAKTTIGVSLEDVKSICDAASALAKGDIAEAGREIIAKAASAALAACGINPKLVENALNLGKQILDKAGDLSQAIGAIGKAFGAEGLASLAAGFLGAF